MNYYPLLRPLLFTMDAEKAHNMAIRLLKYGLLPSQKINIEGLQSQYFSLNFSNPLGLAAGFDKNAECIASLFGQGFGFVEVGTVTPKPQSGNDKPRLFRLTEDKAIINRFGFNSKGADYFSDKLTQWQNSDKRKSHHIVGANIGKNKVSEHPIDDYVTLLKKLYGQSEYVTVNVSSPNTPGLRDIQAKSVLNELLFELARTRKRLIKQHQQPLPILLKISPDMNDEAYQDIADLVVHHGMDGIIATNTTIQYKDQLTSPHQQQQGGLSGKPMTVLSDRVISLLYRYTDKAIPIIGVGGITTPEDAYRKITLGASLLQLYSVLIYQGFAIVPAILSYLQQKMKEHEVTTVNELIGINNIH